MEQTDIIIVGAGVVGLAIARAVAMASETRSRDILLVEAQPAIATVTSARNSGVLHAGFYKPGSLKAQLCVAGRKALYDYASARGIPHFRCGKIVVATEDSQVEILQKMKATGATNGIDNLRLISADAAMAMEPEVRCVAALHSPDSGIIDVHNYTLALLGDAESHGTTLALNATVSGGEITADGFIVDIDDTRIKCRTLINAAGLGAQAVARSLRGLDPTTIPQQVLAKGTYFSLTGKQPFKMLIYPVPDVGSMGLHAGCDLAGRVRFGPDIEWVDKIDYTVDPQRVKLFENAVRRYWPGLPDGTLIPDYAGIRPKLAHASFLDTDFVIQTEAHHKVPGLINLYGIESPGLTSSLALAEMVQGLMS